MLLMLTGILYSSFILLVVMTARRCCTASSRSDRTAAKISAARTAMTIDMYFRTFMACVFLCGNPLWL